MDRVYVLCVDKEMEHTDDALLIHCSRCNREIWVSLHNVDKEAVCLHCVKEAIENGTNDMEFKLTLPDIIEAYRYLVKMGRIK